MTISRANSRGRRKLWITLAVTAGLLAVLVWQVDLEVGRFFLRSMFLGQ